MYESLKFHSSDFHLYIFTFDDICNKLLKMLDLNFVTLISLEEFEDNELLTIKNSRTNQEYCWTCTPSIIKYSIEKYKLKNCTYLDADLYFFSNPAVLIEEMGKKSVLITEHRYTPKYNQSEKSGIYCVQFMTFKNNQNGIKVLNWWRNSCNEWCYARFEDGKFGDQKYLDDWTKRFKGIHELKNLGGGIAPWNMQQYEFSNNGNTLLATTKNSNTSFEVIFFHFHGLKILDMNLFALTNYQLFDDCRNLIYTKYIEHLNSIMKTLKYKFNFEYYEFDIPKNFYMLYLPFKNSYLHS